MILIMFNKLHILRCGTTARYNSTIFY